ncbi:MAG: hypothetical protein MK198_11715 [Gracilimonas sp.]|nr:hypothetical protein [Gracilimonas sp.]
MSRTLEAVKNGYEAFTWMNEQDWSNGKVGTLGCSSTAEWQMAVAAMDHPAHAAMVPQGYGAGVGTVGEFHEQGNWYRGGAGQMLFTSWLYSTQLDPMSPKLPKGISQKDLQRLQKFYDMAPQYPRVDWAEAFQHLPVEDIIENLNGPKGIYEEMITRKPNDPNGIKADCIMTTWILEFQVSGLFPYTMYQPGQIYPCLIM